MINAETQVKESNKTLYKKHLSLKPSMVRNISFYLLDQVNQNNNIGSLIEIEKFHQAGQTVSIQYEYIKDNYQSDTHYATAAVQLWFDENKNGGHYKWMEIIKKFNETDP